MQVDLSEEEVKSINGLDKGERLCKPEWGVTVFVSFFLTLDPWCFRLHNFSMMSSSYPFDWSLAIGVDRTVLRNNES